MAASRVHDCPLGGGLPPAATLYIRNSERAALSATKPHPAHFATADDT
eukprot:CAMPEP_0177793234 /NCGR_PEP_ID=MMETSP0491_2-20121128/24962_1 /TAXON_ID=63592 /ORGANISM="Tetraselmis chuii, Strain PLY429" /LENGTH=47 /DNA_ID= /DNA_START= /DNA_END= /DNA_ORIENTATION=